MQSLSSDYNLEEKHVKQAEKMKDDVKRMINEMMDPLSKLEMVDAIQRLGLKYHFEVEIKNAIDTIYLQHHGTWPSSDDLHATALHFRILRQHGYNISQDEFEKFKDEKGTFKAWVIEDVKGLLSLYEASFHGLKGESKIDEARAFTTSKLKGLKTFISLSMGQKVGHALEMPLHWRLPMLEARWFIETYEQEKDMNPTLLHLAKLDYNMVQATHKGETARLARWWVDLGLDKMTFTRDRLVEHFNWCSGMVHLPQFGSFREMLTKSVCLITTIDDCYDVYGTLAELEIFTDLVNRWDVNGIDNLPYYLKIIFLALYNTSNEIGYWTMKERGFNIIPYLTKAWADLCTAYLKEARWYHGGFKPRLEEYLDNAVISIAAPLMLLFAYFLTTDEITEEALRYIDQLPSIIRSSSMLLRLTDDLGTSAHELKRGDNLKAVECYMNQTGVSEDDARYYIMELIQETWKTANRDMFGEYPFSEPFKSACPNLGRTAHFFYQYDDGHGISDRETKDRIMKLLVDPIPLD